MTELEVRRGDYVPDGLGGVRRLEGSQALAQRVLFRLIARRGTFPFRQELGSRLWQLGRLPAAQRAAAAKQYVTEALQEETDLSVESVALTEGDGGTAQLQVALTCGGQTLQLALEVQI